jgi:hypothetical protein
MANCDKRFFCFSIDSKISGILLYPTFSARDFFSSSVAEAPVKIEVSETYHYRVEGSRRSLNLIIN